MLALSGDLGSRLAPDHVDLRSHAKLFEIQAGLNREPTAWQELPLIVRLVVVQMGAVAMDGLAQAMPRTMQDVTAVPSFFDDSASGPIQLDAGNWQVTASLFDSETNENIADHTAIDVFVPGQVHERQEFDDSAAYEIGVEIQSVEKLGKALYRVHYLLENKGSTTVPPGMLVRGMIVENEDVTAWQDYHFEVACPPGQPDAKYLTLEGSAEFQEAVVYVIADPEGPSETTATVHATSSGGAVHITA